MTEETTEHGVPLYVVTDWGDRFPWLFAGITHAGSGPDPFDFRLFGEPASEQAPARWSDLLQASAFETIVHARQIHETRIVIHERVGAGVQEAEGGADGHATADSGILLAVTVADCVPVYLLGRGRASGGASARRMEGNRGGNPSPRDHSLRPTVGDRSSPPSRAFGTGHLRGML